MARVAILPRTYLTFTIKMLTIGLFVYTYINWENVIK